VIYSAGALQLPLELSADLCVVGSGPGGATVAMKAAEAGQKVVVLEAGELLTPRDMSQREEAMFPRLFWDAGTRTTADRAIHVHQGLGVGGSSIHNTCLVKRIPARIRERWANERGLADLGPARWEALYGEAEALLQVSEVPAALRNRHNQLLADGCAALGWAGGALRHNRTGCVGSGFCELGCAFDAKNNALKVAIPRAVRAGAEVIACCQAVSVAHDGRRVEAVEAVALDPGTRTPLGRVRVRADRVCLSASATGTAALLLRSGVPDPSGETGARLHLHPGAVVAGEFEAPVRAWDGIPQSYECTEYLELDRDGEPGAHRVWIVPAFAHPVGTATLVPGLGAEHFGWMSRYEHLAAFTVMLHDQSRGRVAPRGALGLRIDYRPDEADRRELGFGLAQAARLLFAAGARRVLVSGARPTILARGAKEAELDALAELAMEGGLDLTSVHPMATVPMGDSPAAAAVDSAGRHHHLAGLWVADGSLFPSSIGVPPQLSIYALGLHVGERLVSG
jgi:choline dehydrogenase-like flavoprotein